GSAASSSATALASTAAANARFQDGAQAAVIGRTVEMRDATLAAASGPNAMAEPWSGRTTVMLTRTAAQGAHPGRIIDGLRARASRHSAVSRLGRSLPEPKEGSSWLG